MKTTLTEVGDDVFQVSTYVPNANMTFNQFLLRAEEPLLFHMGPQELFPRVAREVRRVAPLEDIRWLSFGHLEADECGAMNRWLAAAPSARVVHGTIGVAVSLDDMADRSPLVLADGDSLDLGDRRVRWIDTPHVPHGWDAGLLFEETASTLFAGDLFTQAGKVNPLTMSDIVGPAIFTDRRLRATAITPLLAPTLRALAGLAPERLALMHGPTFTGDAAESLCALADYFTQCLEEAVGGGVDTRMIRSA